MVKKKKKTRKVAAKRKPLTGAALKKAQSDAGKRSHTLGTGHEWNSQTASAAGKKGAAARAAKKAADVVDYAADNSRLSPGDDDPLETGNQ